MGDSPSAGLLQSAIVEGIPPDAVKKLCNHGSAVTFQPGHVLFERGQDANTLMILQEGVVELLFPVQILGATRDLTMETKQIGDVVAWSSMVSPYHFTLSAKCASRCTLLSFTRDSLHTCFSSDPETGYLFMKNLAGVIGRRLQAMQTIWLHDLQASAARRLE